MTTFKWTKTLKNTHLSETARGRALATVSWFLTGQRPVESFDKPQISIKDLSFGLHADVTGKSPASAAL